MRTMWSKYELRQCPNPSITHIHDPTAPYSLTCQMCKKPIRQQINEHLAGIRPQERTDIMNHPNETTIGRVQLPHYAPTEPPKVEYSEGYEFSQKKDVFTRILENARTFKVPLSSKPTDLGRRRLHQFYEVLSDEVEELLDIHSLTNVADTLADIVVYCLNEAARWGIPIEEVLHLVLDSQQSKLLPNGEPLWAEDGSKYLKGPNFVPPEPAISELLSKRMQ